MTSVSELTKQKLLLRKSSDGTGLILQTNTLEKLSSKLVFTRASYNRTGNYLAAATLNGDILIINFAIEKFWLLSHLNSCTALKFSTLSDTQIVAGLRDGCVKVFDVDNAIQIADLKNHTYHVNKISFSTTKECLTGSKLEAVIWDMRTWCVIRILTLERNCFIKDIMFVPVTGDILACFHDDIIHVWKGRSYDNFKQILPAQWNKVSVKSIAVTRNGRAALIGGRSPFIATFLLETWNLHQNLYLPNHIKSVKQMDFIPHIFDDGSSNLLCILAGSGIIYVYNINENLILFEIGAPREITNFVVSNSGKYMACVLCTGEVFVYDVTELIYEENNEKSLITVKGKKKHKLTKNVQFKKALIPQEEVEDVFNVEKLKAILKQYGQYPNAYRPKIWEHVLQLPCNSRFYNMIIKHPVHNKFDALESEFPLVNKMALINLKRTLNNLITWCPFFSHVNYLPFFVFPFIQMFHAAPVLCFEAIITIIINFCQRWFEYFPLPPMNILGMIENILLEHDPRLLDHLMKNDVTSTMYAWSLLKVAFSETMTAQEWLIFWDHVIINEPAFLLTAVVAFNITNRAILLSLCNPSDFYRFYHSPNISDIKQFIAKTYQLLQTTSDRNHPRKYLNAFAGLQRGTYPVFSDYPKSLVDYKENTMRSLEDEEQELEFMKKSIFEEKDKIQQSMQNVEIQEEQNKRLKDLERIYHKKIADEQRRILQEKKKLIEMQRELHEEELAKLVASRDKLLERSVREKCAMLHRLIENVESNKFAEELEMEKAHSTFLQQRKELLEIKSQIEEFLQPNSLPKYTAHSSVVEQQKSLTEQIRKVIENVKSQSTLKRLNIVTGLAAIEDLIESVELELAKEISVKYKKQRKKEKEHRVKELQKQTENMEAEVFALQILLDQAKIAESQKVTEIFKAKASVASSIDEQSSVKGMSGVSDGLKAPPTSTEEL